MQLLLVNPTWPRYDRDSGSFRLLQVLTALRESGHDVAFCPRDPSEPEPYRTTLERLGVEVLGLASRRPRGPLERHLAYRRLARFLARSAVDVAVLCGHRTSRHLAPRIRSASPGTTIVTDCVDLHYLRLRREAELHGDGELLRRARREERLELATYAASDVVLAISEEEARLLRERLPGTQVEVLPNVHPLLEGTPGHAAREHLFFIGSFDHPPNVDALGLLGGEILPRLRAIRPGLRLKVAGGGGPQPLPGADAAGVDVLGFVDDLEPLLTSSLALIAPLRFGAGAKGKVGQALASGLPVVTTGIGAEGLGLVDRESVLLAETPDGFRDRVLELQRDRELWERLARNGREVVRRRFSPEIVRAALDELLARWTGTVRARRGR